MKRILVLSLFFLCSFCRVESISYATTWAGTAANQAITRTAMNNLYSIYTQGESMSYYPWCNGGTIPSNSLQLITKSFALSSYCGIGNAGDNVPIYIKNTSKASNALLVKSDIGFFTEAYNATSSSDCSFSSGYSDIYINSDFTKAYTNSAQTTLFNGGGTGYMLARIYLSSNYAYCVIDASGNITTLIASTC